MTLLLDFDGTLGNTQDIILHTLQATIHELRLPERTDEQCTAIIGLPLTQCFISLYDDPSVVDDKMSEMCAATYRRIFDTFNTPTAVPLFPGVAETIRQLHQQGLQLTIASSRSHKTLDNYVKNLQLGDYIKYVLGVEDVEVGKPGPEPVLKTLRDLNLKAEDCLVVGDTKYDIQMAHNAGVKAIGVTYGNGSRQELEEEHTEWIIDDFTAIPDIILKID